MSDDEIYDRNIKPAKCFTALDFDPDSLSIGELARRYPELVKEIIRLKKEEKGND